MATALHIPLNEYLGASYRPDREYVDGEIRERNVGKWEHARLQWLLAAWFFAHERQWGIIGSTEQRVRVSESRVRAPDLVVLTAGAQPYVLWSGMGRSRAAGSQGDVLVRQPARDLQPVDLGLRGRVSCKIPALRESGSGALGGSACLITTAYYNKAMQDAKSRIALAGARLANAWLAALRFHTPSARNALGWRRNDLGFTRTESPPR